MLSRRAYIAAFVVGCASVIGGIGLGVYQSVTADRRLPPVNISNIGEIQDLLDARKYEEAISRLGMSLELIPQNHHVLLNMRGNARNALGQYDNAIDDFRRATEIEPGFVEAYNNLGIAYIGNGAMELAVAQFDRAVRLDPTFAVARQNLERAVLDYEASIGAATMDPETRAVLTDAHATLAGAPPGRTAPTTAPAAPTVVESDDLQQARTFAERFFDGDLDWLHATFTDDFAARMSLTDLTRFRSQVSDRLGVENELLGDRVVDTDGGRLYKRWSRFNKYPGVVELAFDLRADWTVDDLRIRLSETAPDELR